ncbi:hypothetical protein H8R02_28455 [Ramlibacter sp. GTP1]|uniref:Uncharacterized protein n=1 Tax=Ramlibacter albus TaxID=2079448 RepID=A0A923S5D6_9BURK|nr:hypothetical protein [Ramlibacter albus]MBC5768426.1 hypothetical protein [Ramlibacter albus]
MSGVLVPLITRRVSLVMKSVALAPVSSVMAVIVAISRGSGGAVSIVTSRLTTWLPALPAVSARRAM